MSNDFAAAMRRAAVFARAHKVVEATRIIQNALARQSAFDDHDAEVPLKGSPAPKHRPTLRLIDPEAQIIEPLATGEPSSTRTSAAVPESAIGAVATTPSQRPRRPLGEVLNALREGRIRNKAFATLPSLGLPGMSARSTPPQIADGAQFLTRSFACAAGARDYKLYIPACAARRPRGLIVMLHGCKQNPDDFAAGTTMNTVAEAHGLMVAYPGQTCAANAASCWNWFSPANQIRDAGEPSIIAGMTRSLMSEFALDRHQVFVAGLSAGGAMAAVMGETYRDLYAGVGIHSGLPYRCANDVVSAFAAMRGDTGFAPPAHADAATAAEFRVRTIVFHGTADQTVHPSNAARIVSSANQQIAGHDRQDYSSSTGGRTYTRTVIADPRTGPVVECWLINDAGHAWCGGHRSGSYTDPHGPDASREMVRFFLN